MTDERVAQAEAKRNPFEERTRRTFEMLRNGEVNVDDMALSELKSYFTGLGFFKQEEVVHYQLIQSEIQLRQLYLLHGKELKRHLSKKKLKENPSNQNQNQRTIGRRIKDWFKKSFTCLTSSSSGK